MIEASEASFAHEPDRVGYYLRHGLYDRLGVFESSSAVCEAMSLGEGPLIIGVDGPSTGGKTSITDALVSHYQAKDIPVAVMPVDFFMTDRDVRARLTEEIKLGDLGPDEYSLQAWDHEKYNVHLHAARDIIARPAGSPTETLIIPQAYSRLTGKQDQVQAIEVSPGGVVIAEGTGIHVFHDEAFDRTVRVDVRSTQTLLERLKTREHLKPVENRLSDEYLIRRYGITDVPNTNFLRRASAGRADYVVDTTNVAELRLYKNNKIKRAHK